MTKHLRLIMLSLLAMICMGGYSQSDKLYKTLSFPDENSILDENGINNGVTAYDKEWTAKIGTDTWTISNFNNNKWDGWKSIKCGSRNFDSKASIATDTDLGAAITKVVVNYGKVGNANKITACYLQVASDANFKNIIERKKTTQLTTKTTKTEFIVTEPAVGRYFKVVYELTKASKNGFVEIKNVEYFTKSDKADSEIKFKEAVKEVELKTETLSLSDLIDNPHNLPLTYSTSDKETAEEVGGTLLLYKTGKVTVTASFAGDDTYAATSTSMELTIVDNRQDAGIHFAKDSYTADIAKGTFNGAELVNPNGFGVVYKITPTTGGVSIAQDGTVTYPAVDATYTVTAKFAGNDTYKPATATYTLNVVDPNLEIQTIEFVAGVDKGNKGKSDSFTEGDIIEKDGISVNCDMARLGCASTDGYRIYKDGLLTISSKLGDITKITFDDLGTADDLPDNLEPESGNYDKVNYVWTGKGKSIRFKVNVKAFLSKITVTVKVPVAKGYTLDENSVNTIEAYENANVTLNRKLVGDVWNTLSVPFSLSAEQAKEAFGDEVQLRELESVQDNTLNFKTVNSITAGVPCLIKLTKAFAKDTYTFTGVQTIAAKADDLAEGEVKGTISFIGIYSPTDVTKWASADKEYAVFLGAGNQFFKAQAGTEMKGFRAFFLVPNNVPNSAVKVVIDGTATGIEDLVIDGVKANGRVYNLNGQYVSNSLNGLQPGIYIQNGKKIVVK